MQILEYLKIKEEFYTEIKYENNITKIVFDI